MSMYDAAMKDVWHCICWTNPVKTQTEFAFLYNSENYPEWYFIAECPFSGNRSSDHHMHVNPAMLEVTLDELRRGDAGQITVRLGGELLGVFE